MVIAVIPKRRRRMNMHIPFRNHPLPSGWPGVRQSDDDGREQL